MVTVFFACSIATTRVGIVESVDGVVRLRALDGAAVTLVLDEASAPIRHLDGLTVEVAGPRAGGALAVRDWSVRDAGDGSGGWVGVLRAYGARLVLDDRNSGGTVILEDETSAPLRPYIGRPVLLVGTVVSGDLVRVVAWRALDG